jgi:hypothetical protein
MSDCSTPILQLNGDLPAYSIFQRVSWISITLIFYAWSITSNMSEIKQLPKSTYSKRLKILTNLCVSSWLLFYKLLMALTNVELISKGQIGELLIIGHSELGKCGMCASDKCNFRFKLASFLKTVINHMTSLNDTEFQSEYMQCHKVQEFLRSVCTVPILRLDRRKILKSMKT